VTESARIAYLSMEIALEDAIPTYSGGLGVLAGDTLRAAADLGVPMVGVSLLYRRGHFEQTLDAEGRQSERPVSWSVERHLDLVDAKASIELEGRLVEIRAWRYCIRGATGHIVPTYLLDVDLPVNDAQDRELTGTLYGGEEGYRLRQEVLLGIGGVRMLRALGYDELERFHLNEGHAAFAVLALLEEQAGPGTPLTGPLLERCHGEVRRHCVFTTHTPVPAGHDVFPQELVEQTLGAESLRILHELGAREQINLTALALRSSRFINGVAMRHGEVSRDMFPRYPIRSITNGIHPATWISPPFRELFDQHIPGWERDPLSLRYAVGIALEDIDVARRRAKGLLLDAIERSLGVSLDRTALTIGFARRSTAYKRATLVFHDLERLRSLVAQQGPLQLIFSGKAHPADTAGKQNIEAIFRAARKLGENVRVVYVPNYGMNWGRLLCAGADVWLNNPIPPLEASGTSGMKAALNGVPSLSVIDGWWVEGHIENVTGWAIGEDGDTNHLAAAVRDALHASALYDKLESHVLPCFYSERERFLEICRSSIAQNASFFNTHRMVIQYLYNAYGHARAHQLVEETS